MKIVQFISNVREGDNATQEALLLRKILLQHGFDTEIYADRIDKEYSGSDVTDIKYYDDRSNIIVIYHLCMGCPASERVLRLKARVLIIYHDITRPEYWKGYSREEEKKCRNGMEETYMLRRKPFICITETEAAKQRLLDMGYMCPMHVVPPLVDFTRYDCAPDPDLERIYADGKTNILYKGKITPDCKIEEVLLVFYYFKRLYEKSRLIILGRCDRDGRYFRKLIIYAKMLGLENAVDFQKGESASKTSACLKKADLYLSMSEGDEFAVSMEEAMYAGLPIAAYESTGAAETLGGAGFLFPDKKDPAVIACVIRRILKDRKLRSAIIENERERIKNLSFEKIEEQLMNIISPRVNL